MALTPERVATIRTTKRPDSYYAALWKISRAAVRMARIGRTFKDHPVPPQTEIRKAGRGSLAQSEPSSPGFGLWASEKSPR